MFARSMLTTRDPYLLLGLPELEWLHGQHHLLRGPLSALDFLFPGFPRTSADARAKAAKELGSKRLLNPLVDPPALVEPFQTALLVAAGAVARLTVSQSARGGVQRGCFFGDGEHWVLCWADAEGFHLGGTVASGKLAKLVLGLKPPSPGPATEITQGCATLTAGACLTLGAAELEALQALAANGLGAGLDEAKAVSALAELYQDPAAALTSLVAGDWLQRRGGRVVAATAPGPWLPVLAAGYALGVQLEVAGDQGVESVAMDFLGHGARRGRLRLGAPTSPGGSPLVELECVDVAAAVAALEALLSGADE